MPVCSRSESRKQHAAEESAAGAIRATPFDFMATSPPGYTFQLASTHRTLGLRVSGDARAFVQRLESNAPVSMAILGSSVAVYSGCLWSQGGLCTKYKSGFLLKWFDCETARNELSIEWLALTRTRSALFQGSIGPGRMLATRSTMLVRMPKAFTRTCLAWIACCLLRYTWLCWN